MKIKMKIGFFTDTYFPDINGVTYVVSEWKKILEKNHDVYVIYPKSNHVPEHNEIPVAALKFPFYEGYRIGSPLPSKEIKKIDFDVVHVHGIFSMALMGLIIAKQKKIPRFLTYHTPISKYMHYLTKNKPIKEILDKIYLSYEKKILNNFIVTAPSKVISKELENKGVHALVLSNGINLDFFHSVSPSNFKKKNNITNKRVIGFCGRIGYEKRIEDLINIASRFDGEILIVGCGPAKKYYQDLASKRKLKNIKFLGMLKREELSEFYSALDLFIFPSVVETQGLVALESMACGVPVVGANAMALRETITEGETGYLYTPGDTEDLLEKIEKAYENRDILSARCKEKIKEHSIRKSVEKLLEIYSKYSF